MKDNKLDLNGLSKYCAMLLRHRPEVLDLKMDISGWVSVDELIRKINSNRRNKIDIDVIKEMVATNDKQRFALEERKTGLFIRANQGHSIKSLDMGYESIKPPDFLYHGTGEKYINSILKQGLLHKGRQYVHLSADYDMAVKVGSRHGKVRVLKLDTKRMYEDGIVFYRSENGVWLTEYVDPKYFRIIWEKE